MGICFGAAAQATGKKLGINNTIRENLNRGYLFNVEGTPFFGRRDSALYFELVQHKPQPSQKDIMILICTTRDAMNLHDGRFAEGVFVQNAKSQWVLIVTHWVFLTENEFRIADAKTKGTILELKYKNRKGEVCFEKIPL